MTSDVTVSTEGSNQSAIGTVVDKAGNTASKTESGLKIDKTAPYDRRPTTSQNSYGRYKSSFKVHFTLPILCPALSSIA
jgi:hypothetical protein